MNNIKPKMIDGHPRCHDECPALRKSAWEQVEPSTCRIGDYAPPGETCIPWYVNRIAELEAENADLRVQLIFWQRGK